MSAVLARVRLGVPAVTAFVLAAVAPLTVGAGVVPTTFAVTGVVGVPVAFVAVAVVLGVFAVGYLAMAARLPGAGAFYVFIARGLGRPAGVVAALWALAGYNLLQVGLYGVVGAAVNAVFGWSTPWWVWALAAWALVVLVGVRRVDRLGRVLGVLLVAEIAALTVFTVSGLLHPAGNTISAQAISPSALATSGVASVFALGTLAFLGFETAVVYSAEARTARVVRVATYLALGVMAVLYAASSWALTVATGPDRVQAAAQAAGPDLLFTLAKAPLGPAAATLGRLLFATSLLAALLAFHAAVSRYVFNIATDGVLPRALTRVSGRTGAPIAASAAQNTLALAVIAGYALAGADPVVKLFFWGGGIGGVTILALLAATSIAVLAWFARHPDGETRWRRIIAPALAAVALLVMLGLTLTHLATLLGVEPGHPLLTAVPAGLCLLAATGVGWALLLRAARPDLYTRIARGPAHPGTRTRTPGTTPGGPGAPTVDATGGTR